MAGRLQPSRPTAPTTGWQPGSRLALCRPRAPQLPGSGAFCPRTCATCAPITLLRRKCWPSSPRRAPSRLSWPIGSSAAPMKRASTTRGRPVRFVPSGQVGTAGPANACTNPVFRLQSGGIKRQSPLYFVIASRRLAAWQSSTARRIAQPSPGAGGPPPCASFGKTLDWHI